MERRASPRLGQQTGSNHLAEKPKKARENREEPWICSGVHPGSAVRRHTGVVAALMLQVSAVGVVGSGPVGSEV